MTRKTPKQKSRRETLTELRLSPIFRAAQALQALGSSDLDSDIDAEALAALTIKLTKNFQSINSGSTNEIEQLLYAQIVTLNEIFFALIASYHKQENAQLQSEALDKAFRAADLSRKSSALLVEIKNPKRATFIKNQMNQLNIHDSDSTENPNLLEPTFYAPLDTGSQTETIGKNPNLATVAELNRSPN